MLDFNVQAQIDLFRWFRLGGLFIEEVKIDDIDRIIALSEKYSDIPMDLADASLVILSEKLKIKEIITIDSDYHFHEGGLPKLIRLRSSTSPGARGN